jgi:RNA polymerase sigma-70 factor (ECF subfamily)
VTTAALAPPPPSPGSEAERDRTLVNRIKGGDQSAFEEIVARYKGRIYSMTHRFIHDHQDAEELTQDTFIRALRGLPRFRGDSAFSTWLYRIAINLARNRYHFRSRRGRDQTTSFDAPLDAFGKTTLGDVIPAGGGSPYDAAVNKDLVERLQNGMKLLSSKHRQILILRHDDDTPYEEISKILNISVGTVKSRIARAREYLHASIFDNEAADGRTEPAGATATRFVSMPGRRRN